MIMERYATEVQTCAQGPVMPGRVYSYNKVHKLRSTASKSPKIRAGCAGRASSMLRQLVILGDARRTAALRGSAATTAKIAMAHLAATVEEPCSRVCVCLLNVFAIATSTPAFRRCGAALSAIAMASSQAQSWTTGSSRNRRIDSEIERATPISPKSL